MIRLKGEKSSNSDSSNQPHPTYIIFSPEFPIMRIIFNHLHWCGAKTVELQEHKDPLAGQSLTDNQIQSRLKITQEHRVAARRRDENQQRDIRFTPSFRQRKPLPLLVLMPVVSRAGGARARLSIKLTVQSHLRVPVSPI